MIDILSLLFNFSLSISMVKPSNSIVFFALVIFVHTAEKIFESPKNPATKTEPDFFHRFHLVNQFGKFYLFP